MADGPAASCERIRKGNVTMFSRFFMPFTR
jgi:hypothetical protein